MQLSFSSRKLERLPLPDADIRFCPDWLSQESSDEMLGELGSELMWTQPAIAVYGKRHKIPRSNAWYGDSGAEYGYSGFRLQRHDWHPKLLQLKRQLEHELNSSFNSVLANWYVDGSQGMGWHSDNEPELGQNPVIASVSLGGPRRFQFKHRYKRELVPLSIELPSGSLLVMAGATQYYWQHQVPKTKRQVRPRINLTYRQIFVNQ